MNFIEIFFELETLFVKNFKTMEKGVLIFLFFNEINYLISQKNSY